MNINPTEPEFQRLFVELKRADALQTPAFEPLTRTEAPMNGTVPSWWLVSVSLAVFFGVVLSHQNQIRPPMIENDFLQWADYSTWATPSDELLGVVNSIPTGEMENPNEIK